MRGCRRSTHFLGVEPNPIPVKALLHGRAIGHGLRLPLLPLSARTMPPQADRAGALHRRTLEHDHAATPLAA